MAVIMGDASSPDEVYLRRGSSGSFVRLTRFREDVRRAFAVSDVRPVSWPSRDGKYEVRGFLVTPTGSPSGSKLPLVVDIHGGPGVYYQNHFPAVHLEGGGGQIPAELLASHGYAVLCPNPRGDAAYTMDYAKPGLASWDLKIDDVLAGVEALVARGIADPDRLGVTGGSFGGWGAVAAISRSKLFRAAVAHDGPLDVTTEMALEYRRSLLSNWTAFTDIFGGAPFDVRLPAIDPTTIRTPLLLRFGAQASDPAHPESFYVSGMGVYAYLDCHGVPVEMLVHPNESHGIFDPKTLRDYVDRAMNWFDYWLAGAVYHDDWRREEFDAWKTHPGQTRPCRSDL
jgi:dipeptidyl aminopeptidase/acylaminoacyl peptidase